MDKRDDLSEIEELKLAHAVASSRSIRVGQPTVELASPGEPGRSRFVVLREPAGSVSDADAVESAFRGPPLDPSQLTPSEFVRFSVWFLNGSEPSSQAVIDEIEIPYTLPPSGRFAQ